MTTGSNTESVIRVGYHVIVKKIYDEENIKVFKVEPDRLIYYGKLNFRFNSIIGASYGTIYEIKDNDMICITDFSQIDSDISEQISCSSTFDEKTQFSQEKYLKKKKKRFSNIVTVLKPNLRMIEQAYYNRDKIGGLRIDILSQILTYANIHDGSKSIIVDNNYGLITAAVLSRSIPHGTCLQVSLETGLITSYRQAVEALDITKNILDNSLFAIKASDIVLLRKGIDLTSSRDYLKQPTCRKKKTKMVHNTSNLEEDFDEERLNESHELDETLIKKEANRAWRIHERNKAAEMLKASCMDALIIASQCYHPLALLKLLLPFLLPSRPFVIYSDTVEPLVECHEYIKSKSCAVSLTISETWLRMYQVLPDRTRPLLRSFGLCE